MEDRPAAVLPDNYKTNHVADRWNGKGTPDLVKIPAVPSRRYGQKAVRVIGGTSEKARTTGRPKPEYFPRFCLPGSWGCRGQMDETFSTPRIVRGLSFWEGIGR